LKPVRFSPHALEKLALTQGWGFAIDEETVIDSVRRPHGVMRGYLGRSIAFTILDERHELRVVYEEGVEIVIVTLYPARRRRHENQI
jgi:hypothetical protein